MMYRALGGEIIQAWVKSLMDGWGDGCVGPWMGDRWWMGGMKTDE